MSTLLNNPSPFASSYASSYPTLAIPPASFPSRVPKSSQATLSALALAQESSSALELQEAQKQTTIPGAKKQRTKGLWLFDTMLYPILTNFAVFAISVFATYQTTYGKPGNWMRQRGDVVRHLLHNRLKLPKGSVDMAVMLGFSFLDGCVMAPVVKLFEDRRSTISKWLDKKLGSTPADPSVYDQEPKQSWASVLGGRATACATIVPSAVILDKKWGGAHSLNDVLFSNPGKRIGQFLEKALPVVSRKLPNLNLPGLSKIAVFEAFYTSLTTVALYLSSRLYASLGEKGKKNAEGSGLPDAALLATARTTNAPSAYNNAPNLQAMNTTKANPAYLAGASALQSLPVAYIKQQRPLVTA